MAFFLLMAILLATVVVNSNRILQDHADNSMQQTMYQGVNNLQKRFDANESALASISAAGILLDDLRSPSELKRSVTAQKILQQVGYLTLGNPLIRELVIYDNTYDVYLHKVHGTAMSVEYLEAVKSLVRERPASMGKSGSWSVYEVDGRKTFILSYHRDTLWLCAVLPAEDWIRESFAGSDDMAFLLTDRSGEELLTFGGSAFPDHIDLSGIDNARWVQGRTVRVSPMDFGSFRLFAGMEARSILGNYALIQVLIIVMVILAIIGEIVLTLFVKCHIMSPISILTETMKKLENGHYDVRLTAAAPNREFQTINHAFNSMLDTIIGLQMKAYEDRIQFDEATLKYVQLQIRPHFFLNALTTIHSMTFQHREEDIREYIERLSKNVRYLFKAGLHTVPLSEEVEHVKDYIGMQNMQYPDAVFHFIEVDPALETYQIPQLLIHTMVENIYKHAVSVDRLTCILISAKPEEYKGEEVCHLSVEDDGAGFPQTFLDQMVAGDVQVSRDGRGVGLWNLKKTLSLMYHRDDLITFSNKSSHGSRVDMWIPRHAKRQSAVWKL